MQIEILKSKLAKVRVTDAQVNYEGSITLDPDLMQAAALFPFEKVDINGCSNDHRITTYVIAGRKGSGEVCLNGGAALHFKKGDEIHVLSYAVIDIDARFTHNAGNHQPRIVKTNFDNRVIKEKDPVIKKLKPIIHKP